MNDRDEIKAGLRLVIRIAIEKEISAEDLIKMVREIYNEAHRKSEEPKPVRAGSFVNYWDPKKGQNIAHVLEVHPNGTLEIRVHRTAQPDYNVDNVPYAEKPTKGHWSRR